MNNYRLYTFVANNYLSQLQCGLQTAHVVSELSRKYSPKIKSAESTVYADWARDDTTIIICAAGNHRGVLGAHLDIGPMAAQMDLPSTIFREDEDSMNGMATAFGVIVPEKFWDVKFIPGYYSNRYNYAKYIYAEDTLNEIVYREDPDNCLEFNFISKIKSYRLA